MTNKKICIEYKRWMAFAAFALGAFVISYFTAAHFPDCLDCQHGQQSFIQVWSGVVSVITLIASVIFASAAILIAQEGH